MSAAPKSDLAIAEGAALAVLAVPGFGIAGAIGQSISLGFDAAALTLGALSGLALGGVLFAPYVARSGATGLAQFLGLRYGRPVQIIASAVIVVMLVLGLAALIDHGARLVSLAAPLPGPAAPALVGLGALLIAFAMTTGRSTAVLAVLFAIVAIGFLIPLAEFSLRDFGLPLPQVVVGDALNRLLTTEFEIIEQGRVDFATFKTHAKPFAMLSQAEFASITLTLAAAFAILPPLIARYAEMAGPRLVRRAVAWAVALAVLVLSALPTAALLAKQAVYEVIAQGTPLTALPAWMEPLSRADALRVHGVSLRHLEDVRVAVALGAKTVQKASSALRSTAPVTAAAWAKFKPEVRAALLEAASQPVTSKATWEQFRQLVLPVAALAQQNVEGVLTQGALSFDQATLAATLPDVRALSAPLALLWLAALFASVLALAGAVAHAAAATLPGGKPTVSIACAVVIVVAAILGFVLPPALLALAPAGLVILASALFPVSVLGIWWRRANAWGAVAGMVAGLAVGLVLMIGSRTGANWFGIHPMATTVLAIPVGFIVATAVSLITPPPGAGTATVVDRLRGEPT